MFKTLALDKELYFIKQFSYAVIILFAFIKEFITLYLIVLDGFRAWGGGGVPASVKFPDSRPPKGLLPPPRS